MNEYSYQEYDYIEDYNNLSLLFDKIYLGDRDQIGQRGMSSFLKHFISNLCKSSDGYSKIVEKLSEMKLQFKIDESDTALFHINGLLDDAAESYKNSQSKALSFKEALQKVKVILK